MRCIPHRGVDIVRYHDDARVIAEVDKLYEVIHLVCRNRVKASHRLIEQQKLIAEGAGAVSVAAVMFDKVPVKGKKVVCLVSGGNIDVTILSRVIHRGLVKSGRTALLNIELLDKPGQLLGVSKIIAQLGGNVVGVHHEHVGNSDINGCYLRIEMETRNFEHLNEIRKALTEAGFKIVD